MALIPKWVRGIAPHAPTILGWAKKNLHPPTYAQVAVDAMPPAALEDLMEAAMADDFVDASVVQVLRYFPPAKESEQWFREFLSAIETILTEPDDASDSEDSAS
jgi:hypothetical protein